MPISDKLIDQLLDGCDSPEDILGEAGLLKQLTKKVAERALEAEMEAHLGYGPNEVAGNNSGTPATAKRRKTFAAPTVMLSSIFPAIATAALTRN